MACNLPFHFSVFCHACFHDFINNIYFSAVIPVSAVVPFPSLAQNSAAPVDNSLGRFPSMTLDIFFGQSCPNVQCLVVTSAAVSGTKYIPYLW